VATLRGGDRFEKALAQISAMLRTSPTVARVGFLENAKYPDGTPVAAIALIQDMGAPGAGIPPRPFFRNMIAAKQGEWPAAIARLLRENNYDARVALGIRRRRDSGKGNYERASSPGYIALQSLARESVVRGLRSRSSTRAT
jgi:hypothetical protein